MMSLHSSVFLTKNRTKHDSRFDSQNAMKPVLRKNSLALLFKTAIILLGLAMGLGLSHAQDSDKESLIPFETVEQVFDAMESNQDAARTDYDGWIIYNIKNEGSYTLWSLTPEDHPANPTAVRRDVVSVDGIITIQMNALCQADKVSCDKLMAEFREINADIKQRMESKGNG